MDWESEDSPDKEFRQDVEIILPTLTFEKEYSIVDEDLEIKFFLTEGHTNCTSFAYIPSEKTIITGDLFFRVCNPDQWILALEKMLSFEIECALPGYGPVSKREGLENQYSFLKNLKDQMIESIESGIKLEEINIELDLMGDNWVIESTKKHWFNFYNNKLEK